MKRPALVLLLFLLACETDSPVAPETPLLPTGAPAHSILDGGREGGTPGFWWLSPIVPEPGEVQGTLDESALDALSIEVCRLEGSACATPLVATFTAETGNACIGRIRVVEPGFDPCTGSFVAAGPRHHEVFWMTRSYDLDPDETYRIQARFGDAIVGHADVDVLADPGDPPADPNDFVRVIRNRSLFIKFVLTDALELGEVVGPGGGTVELGGGGIVLDVPAGALTEATPLTAEIVDDLASLPPGPEPVGGVAYDFGPDGTTFEQPITMTLPFDASALPPGTDPAELRIHEVVDGQYRQMDAGLVDAEEGTVSALVDGFSTFAIVPRSNEGDTEAPRLVSVEVFDPVTQTWGSEVTVDASAGDAQIRTRMRVTDDGTGLRDANYEILSPGVGQRRFLCTVQVLQLVDGSDTNGLWTCDQRIPQYAEAGVSDARRVTLFDNAGNRRRYDADGDRVCDRDNPGDCHPVPTVTIVSDPDDTSPFVLGDVTVSRDVEPRDFVKTLEVHNGQDQDLVFRIPFTDDLSGAYLQRIDGLTHAAPTRFYFGFRFNARSVRLLSCTLAEGTLLAGVLECGMSIAEGDRVGTWTFRRAELVDRVNNFARYDRDSEGNLCRGGDCLVDLPTVEVVEPDCTVGGTSPLALVDAIVAAEEGETITICGGEHDLSSMTLVQKPLHLVGIGSPRPVVRAGSSLSFGREDGAFTLRNLSFESPNVSIVGTDALVAESEFSATLRSRIDRVERLRVESSEFFDFWFTGPPGTAESVSFSGNVIKGWFRVDEGPDVLELLDNEISCPQTTSACVEMRFGRTVERADLSGNTIDCHPTNRACISGVRAEDATLSGNVIRTTIEGRAPTATGDGPSVGGVTGTSSLIVSDNSIEGTGGDRSESGGWPFRDFSCGPCTGNDVDGVRFLQLDDASDMVIGDVAQLRGHVTESDLLGVQDIDQPRGVLTCNWWGDADIGPRVIQPIDFWDSATPWATGPIADDAGGQCDGRGFEPVLVEGGASAAAVPFELSFQDIWGTPDGNRFWAVTGNRSTFPAEGAVFSYVTARASFVADSSGPFIPVVGLQDESAGADLTSISGTSGGLRIWVGSLRQPLLPGPRHAQVMRNIDGGSPGAWRGTNTNGLPAPGRLPGRPLPASIDRDIRDITATGPYVVAVGQDRAYRLVEAPCNWCLIPSSEYWIPLVTPRVDNRLVDLVAVHGQGLTTIAVGARGVILRRTRSDSEGPECAPSNPACTIAWTEEDSGVQSYISSLFALPDGTWLAGTGSGQLLERSNPFDGRWSARDDFPGFGFITAIWGSDADDLYVVSGGALYHLGPSGWTLWRGIGPSSQVTSVWGSSDGSTVLVVGGNEAGRRVRTP